MSHPKVLKTKEAFIFNILSIFIFVSYFFSFSESITCISRLAWRTYVDQKAFKFYMYFRIIFIPFFFFLKQGFKTVLFWFPWNFLL